MEIGNNSEVLARLYIQMIEGNIKSNFNFNLDEKEFKKDYFEKLSASEFYDVANSIKFPQFKEKESFNTKDPYKASVNLFIKLFYECRKSCKCDVCILFKFQKYFIIDLKVRRLKPKTFCMGQGLVKELFSKKTIFHPCPQEFFILCTDNFNPIFKIRINRSNKNSNESEVKSQENLKAEKNKMTEPSLCIPQEFRITDTNCRVFKYSAVWMIVFELGSATYARKTIENKWVVQVSGIILEFSELIKKKPVIVLYKKSLIEPSLNFYQKICTNFISCLRQSQFFYQEFKENLKNIKNFESFIFHTLGFSKSDFFYEEYKDSTNSFHYISKIIYILKSFQQSDVKLLDFILNFPRVQSTTTKNFIWLVDNFEEYKKGVLGESLFIKKNKKRLDKIRSICVVPSVEFSCQDLNLENFLNYPVFKIKFDELEKNLDISLLLLRNKKDLNVFAVKVKGHLFDDVVGKEFSELFIVKLETSKKSEYLSLKNKKERIITKEQFDDFDVICVFYEDSFRKIRLNVPLLVESELTQNERIAFAAHQFFSNSIQLFTALNYENSLRKVTNLVQKQILIKKDSKILNIINSYIKTEKIDCNIEKYMKILIKDFNQSKKIIDFFIVQNDDHDIFRPEFSSNFNVIGIENSYNVDYEGLLKKLRKMMLSSKIIVLNFAFDSKKRFDEKFLKIHLEKSYKLKTILVKYNSEILCIKQDCLNKNWHFFSANSVFLEIPELFETLNHNFRVDPLYFLYELENDLKHTTYMLKNLSETLTLFQESKIINSKDFNDKNITIVLKFDLNNRQIIEFLSLRVFFKSIYLFSQGIEFSAWLLKYNCFPFKSKNCMNCGQLIRFDNLKILNCKKKMDFCRAEHFFDRNFKRKKLAECILFRIIKHFPDDPYYYEPKSEIKLKFKANFIIYTNQVKPAHHNFSSFTLKTNEIIETIKMHHNKKYSESPNLKVLIYVKVNYLERFKVIFSFIGNSIKGILTTEMIEHEVKINENFKNLCEFSTKFYYNNHLFSTDLVYLKTNEMLKSFRISTDNEKITVIDVFEKVLNVFKEIKDSCFNQDIVQLWINNKIKFDTIIEINPNIMGIIVFFQINKENDTKIHEKDKNDLISLYKKLNKNFYSISFYTTEGSSNDFQMCSSKLKVDEDLNYIKDHQDLNEICLVFGKLDQKSVILIEKILRDPFDEILKRVEKKNINQMIDPYLKNNFETLETSNFNTSFKLKTPEILDRVIEKITQAYETNYFYHTTEEYLNKSLLEEKSRIENSDSSIFHISEDSSIHSSLLKSSKNLSLYKTNDYSFSISNISQKIDEKFNSEKKKNLISTFDGHFKYLKTFKSYEHLNTNKPLEAKILSKYALLFFESIKNFKNLQKFESEKLKIKSNSKTIDFSLLMFFFLSGSEAKLIKVLNNKIFRESLKNESISGNKNSFLLVFMKVKKSTLMLYSNLDHTNLCYMNSAFITLGNLQSFRASTEFLIEYLNINKKLEPWLQLVPFEYKNNKMKTKLHNLEKFRLEFDKSSNFFMKSDINTLQNNEKFINEFLREVHKISSGKDHDKICPLCLNFFSEVKEYKKDWVKEFFIEMNIYRPYFCLTTDDVYLIEAFYLRNISLTTGDVFNQIFYLKNQPNVIYLNLNYPPIEATTKNKYQASQEFIDKNSKISLLRNGIHVEYLLTGINLFHRGTHYKALIYKKSRNRWLLINDDLLEKKINNIEDFSFYDEKCLTHSVFYSKHSEILCPFIVNLYLLQIYSIFNYPNDAEFKRIKQIPNKVPDCLYFESFIDTCFNQINSSKEIFKKISNKKKYYLQKKLDYRIPSQLNELLEKKEELNNINDLVNHILLWVKLDTHDVKIQEYLHNLYLLFDDFNLEMIFEIKNKHLMHDPCFKSNLIQDFCVKNNLNIQFFVENIEEYMDLDKSFNTLLNNLNNSQSFTSTDLEKTTTSFSKEIDHIKVELIYRKFKSFNTNNLNEKSLILKYTRLSRKNNSKLIFLKILDYFQIFKDILEQIEENYKNVQIFASSGSVERIFEKIETNFFKKIKNFNYESVISSLIAILDNDYILFKEKRNNFIKRVHQVKVNEDYNFIFNIFRFRIYLSNLSNKKLYFLSEINEPKIFPDILVYFNSHETWQNTENLLWISNNDQLNPHGKQFYSMYSCEIMVALYENSKYFIIKTVKKSIKFHKNLKFDEDFKSKSTPVIQIFYKMKNIAKPLIRVKKQCKICQRKYPSYFSNCRKSRCAQQKLSELITP